RRRPGEASDRFAAAATEVGVGPVRRAARPWRSPCERPQEAPRVVLALGRVALCAVPPQALATGPRNTRLVRWRFRPPHRPAHSHLRAPESLSGASTYLRSAPGGSRRVR